MRPAFPSKGSDFEILRTLLDEAYAEYNHAALISPDPLECVYRYRCNRDREIVGLIAASLAYGRVAQILTSVERVLSVLGPSPCETLLCSNRAYLERELAGFRHRWTTPDELVGLLLGIQGAVLRHGSLQGCFCSHDSINESTFVTALAGFVRELGGCERPSSLLSAPEKGSACKRLHLYLRWMVRDDAVDPGCWSGLSPRRLVVPLDTHMFRIARALGMTQRRQANLKAAMEITRAFGVLAPEDPVRYDFALTRLGIRSDMDLPSFLAVARSVRRTPKGETGAVGLRG